MTTMTMVAAAAAVDVAATVVNSWLSWCPSTQCYHCPYAAVAELVASPTPTQNTAHNIQYKALPTAACSIQNKQV